MGTMRIVTDKINIKLRPIIDGMYPMIGLGYVSRVLHYYAEGGGGFDTPYRTIRARLSHDYETK